MKPFSLDAVLDFRKRLEDLAHARFIAAQNSEQQTRTRLQEEETLYASLVDDADRRQAEGIVIDELLSLEEHLLFVKNKIQILRRELSKRCDKTEQERQNLLKKSKEKQVMEKLKEKQNKEWQQHLNKKEAAMLDEIAILYHDK